MYTRKGFGCTAAAVLLLLLCVVSLVAARCFLPEMLLVLLYCYYSVTCCCTASIHDPFLFFYFFYYLDFSGLRGGEPVCTSRLPPKSQPCHMASSYYRSYHHIDIALFSTTLVCSALLSDGRGCHGRAASAAKAGRRGLLRGFGGAAWGGVWHRSQELPGADF